MATDPDSVAMLAAAQSQASAAWWQFVGSMLGLAIAIAVPFGLHVADRRAKQKDEEARAASLALAILPHLNAWFRHVKPLADSCDKALKDRSQLHSNYAVHLERLLRVPQPVLDRIDELHILGGAALPLQKAIGLAPWLDHKAGDFRTAAQRIEGQGGGQVRYEPTDADLEIFKEWPPMFLKLTTATALAIGMLQKKLSDRLGFTVQEGWGDNFT